MNSGSLGHLVAGNGQIPQTRCWHSDTSTDRRVLPYATGGPLIYFWSENDALKAYRFNGQHADDHTRHAEQLRGTTGMPAGFLDIEQRQPGGNRVGVGIDPLRRRCPWMRRPGRLRGIRRVNLSTELWDSQQSRPGRVGNFAKYVPPTVANGKVNLPTFSNKVRSTAGFATQAAFPHGVTVYIEIDVHCRVI